jgi:hypothetical protein
MGCNPSTVQNIKGALCIHNEKNGAEKKQNIPINTMADHFDTGIAIMFKLLISSLDKHFTLMC